MTKAKTSIMGISPELACAKGYEFELQNPFTKEGLGMFVTVIGPESPAVKAHNRAKINTQLRKEAKGENPATTVEELESAAIETAVVSTVGWRGVVLHEADGELDFTPENARLLYAQTFVRKQVLEAANELGNFKPG